MKSSLQFALLFAAVIALIITGCSKSGTPIQPDDQPSSQLIADQMGSLGAQVENSDREIIAAYLVAFNPDDGTFNLEPVDRIGQYHFNLTAAYPNVVAFTETGNDPEHNGDFYADIRLTHPFPGSVIDGFDARIIAVLPADSLHNVMNFPSFDVLANNKVVMEPDGYTKLFDKWDLDGNTNPFKAYFKDVPYRRFSSTEQTSETLRWYLDLTGFSHGYQFYIICDVSTGFPNAPTPVTDNAPEPVDAEVEITGELYSNGGYIDIEVTILDWQGIDYVTVGIESPALFGSTVSLDYIGPGVKPDTYVFAGEIGNYNQASPGEYLCLINAFDGFAAKGIYTTAKVTVNEAVALEFDDLFFDFSTQDIKEIHVTGSGFGNEQGANTVWLDDETAGFTVSSWRFDEIVIQIPNDNLDHVVQFEIDSVLYDPIPAPESESILVVYNLNSNDSVSIKDYYVSDATGRDIKSDMICELDLSLGESISRTQYNELIRTPIEDFIESNGLKHRIKYIVLTKGIPLKIQKTHGSDYNDLDYAAIDSELSLIFSDEYNLDGRIYNPYYGKPDGSWFHPFKYQMGQAVVAYLVTRLAAWEVEEVYGMIDRALDPYSGPDAYAILDGGKTYDRMESAAVIYEDRGIQHLFENAEIFLTAETINDSSISDYVLAYTGHGIHHSPSPPGGGLYVFELGFGLLNGAIFNTYESSNCTTFNEANRSGMGMVGDWIRIGGTGGIGHVYEPWSDAVGDERFLYPRQVSKHNLAEACYMALKYVSWTETIVGDPLCIVDVQ